MSPSGGPTRPERWCAGFRDGPQRVLMCTMARGVGRLALPLLLAGCLSPDRTFTPLADTRAETSIASGFRHVCARRDGRMLCWGKDIARLDGSDLPARPHEIEGLPPIRSDAGGLYHHCGVADDGVWCWSDTRAPYQLASGSFRGVSPEEGRTCLWSSSGRVACLPLDAATEAIDTTLAGDIVQMVTGAHFTCVRYADGTVGCDGRDDPDLRGAVDIAAELDAVLIVLDDGRLARVDSTNATQYLDGVDDARRVWARGHWYCFTTGTRELSCRGHWIELGEDTPFDPTPIDAPPFAELALTAHAACGVDDDGEVRCWGWAHLGALGTEDGLYRAPVATGITGAIEVGAGGGQTCALLGDGTVRCFGRNLSAELGVEDPYETRGPPLLADIEALDVGGAHACARDAQRRLWCWGDNSFGQIGAGEPRIVTPQLVASDVVDFSTGWARTCWTEGPERRSRCRGYSATGRPEVETSSVDCISTSSEHTCVLQSGNVACWGKNVDGVINGIPDDASYELTPVALPEPIADIETGYRHNCAIGEGGAVYCWGTNVGGALGVSTTSERSPPQRVLGLEASKIRSHAWHTCAIRADSDRLVCWGPKGMGRVTGRPDEHDTLTPTEVAGAPSARAAIAGRLHSCALSTAGEVWCWGYDNFGQVDGVRPTTFVPARVPLPW